MVFDLSYSHESVCRLWSCNYSSLWFATELIKDFTRAHAHTHTHTHTHTDTHTHTHKNTTLRMHKSLTYKHRNAHVHTNAQTHMCAHTRAQTHTLTHTHTETLKWQIGQSYYCPTLFVPGAKNIEEDTDRCR